MAKTLVGLSALLISSISFGASSKQKPSLSLFSGHYGYVLSYPSDYSVKPKFARNEDGSVDEIVNFIPSACKDVNRRQCGELGMFTLFVTPKRTSFKSMGVTTLAEQVDMVIRRAQADGEAPSEALKARFGNLSGFTFIKRAPQGRSFDATTIMAGEKVVYLFQYQHENRRIKPILKSLSEIQPHDNPPRG